MEDKPILQIKQLGHICKYCESGILTHSKSGLFGIDAIRCGVCHKYGFCLSKIGEIEAEIVTNGNFFLVYVPQTQDASIVSSEPKKVLSIVPMNELTHEQVVQWANKLKTYVVFQ